jgi:hypothetical protein
VVATVPGPGNGPGAGSGVDVLVAWAEQSHRPEPDRAGTRFAFYGRVSTEDWQDPVTSRARQRDQAAALAAGTGDRGGVLRCGPEPDAVVGAPPAGRRTGGGAGGSGPGMGRRGVGQAGAPARAGPGHRAGGGVDILPVAGRPQRRADHEGPERCRDPVPVGRRPGTQPAPYWCGVDAAHDGGDQAPSSGTMQLTSPDEARALIDQLRTAGITSTWAATLFHKT